MEQSFVTQTTKKATQSTEVYMVALHARQLPEKQEGLLKRPCNLGVSASSYKVDPGNTFPKDKKLSAWRAPGSGTARSNKRSSSPTAPAHLCCSHVHNDVSCQTV